VGLSRSMPWRMVTDGQFPEPRRISAHAVGWPQREIRTG
jgi:predicted DNA-binding transcriptional regulator AlpA